MHPILLRFPLPDAVVPLLWILGLAAAVAAVVTAFTARAAMAVRGTEKEAGSKSTVGALLALTVALAAAAFRFRTETVHTGPLPIYSYGVMIGISLIVGWYTSLKLGVKVQCALALDWLAANR